MSDKWIAPVFLTIAILLVPQTLSAGEQTEVESDQQASAATAPAESQPAGIVVQGLVLNYLGGGIAGAAVRLESPDANADAPPLAEGQSGRSGDISLTLPKTVKSVVRVRIKMDGYKDWVGEIDPTDEDNPPFVDATLEGAARIIGVVRAMATDKPVSGARINCDTGGRYINAKSGPDGRYKIDNVVRGPARLRIEADGFATRRIGLQVEEDQIEQDVELAAERPVELLVVTNEGDPAANVMIEAWIDEKRGYLEAVTDAAGRAALQGIDEQVEQIRLRLNGDRYVRMTDFSEVVELGAAESAPADSQPAPASSPAGPAPVHRRVVVQLGATVSGKVVDRDTGEPIVGVRVVAGRQARSNMPVIWTSIDGTYELPGLPPGLNIIACQHSDYCPEIQEIQLNAGRTGTLDAKLGRGRPIAGKVVTTDDQPVGQAWVTAEDWKGYQTLGLRTITGEDGSFSLPHAPEGEITFSIVKPGFAPPVRQVLTAGKRDYRIALEPSPVTPGEAGPPPGEVKVPPGQTVPDFTLTGVDGTTYKLAELRGKYVFLDFWASWCGPCVKEMPNIKALHEAMKKRADFVLIGVNLDSERKDFKDFVDKNKIAWPQVTGPKSGAEETFDMLDGMAIPYTCLIGPDGKLITQHIFGPKTVEEVKKHLKD
jgi:peroxiredoxin